MAAIATADKVIKPKLGLLELAKQLGNVSRPCHRASGEHRLSGAGGSCTVVGRETVERAAGAPVARSLHSLGARCGGA